jgi:hypothetical protein
VSCPSPHDRVSKTTGVQPQQLGEGEFRRENVQGQNKMLKMNTVAGKAANFPENS